MGIKIIVNDVELMSLCMQNADIKVSDMRHCVSVHGGGVLIQIKKFIDGLQVPCEIRAQQVDYKCSDENAASSKGQQVGIMYKSISQSGSLDLLLHENGVGSNKSIMPKCVFKNKDILGSP